MFWLKYGYLLHTEKSMAEYGGYGTEQPVAKTEEFSHRHTYMLCPPTLETHVRSLNRVF